MKTTFFDDTIEFLEPNLQKNRIGEIDFLRGFCVLLMVLDHIFYLVMTVFGPQWFAQTVGTKLNFFADFYNASFSYWHSELRIQGHFVAVFIFFSVSGISGKFSHNKTKRANILILIATIFSFATLYIENSMNVSGTLVTFGVLHCLAVCMLFHTFIEEIANKLCKSAFSKRLFLCSFFGGLTLVVAGLYMFYVPPKNTPLPLFIFFPADSFVSQSIVSPGDFFPIIPYAGFFFFGVAVSQILYQKQKPVCSLFQNKIFAPIKFVGKHALVIYLLHLGLISLFFAFLSFVLVTPGNWILF